ncbi:MAG: porin family protein [Bacteroidales bacterium]|nr:porin family protein [Bacteroidales bacterium]
MKYYTGEKSVNLFMIDQLKKTLLKATGILFVLLLFSTLAQAQKQKPLNLPSFDNVRYHFGFILGVNQMLFSVKTVDNLSSIKWSSEQMPDFYAVDSAFVYSINAVPTPGFTIGIVGNLHLSQHFNLRFVPSLSFGERLLHYNIMTYNSKSQDGLVEIKKSIASTIVEFPLELKYKSRRLNNVAGYVLGGVKYSIDLASQKKVQDNASDVTVKLNRHDIALELGVGFDFYTNYFKFGTQIKMGYGLNNLIIREGNIYTNSIDQLRSKIFLLSFTFEG